MPIKFYPKAGMVLICDFSGYMTPEIVKKRPVVVISPNKLNRPGLCTVIPLSKTAPHVKQPYHLLLDDPVNSSNVNGVWAKCDLVATVSVERLDRIKYARGKYKVGKVSHEVILQIRVCASHALGIVI